MTESIPTSGNGKSVITDDLNRVQGQPALPLAEPEIDLLGFASAIWQRWWLILLAAGACGLAGYMYASSATRWYRAEVLLIPAEDRSSQGVAAQLGGLASLAGIRLGATSTVEPVAVLQSRDFARDFIESQGLLPILFADQYDAERKSWATRSGQAPDIREAVRFFERRVLSVSEDRKTGLVSVAVTWRDAEQAAEWAGLVVDRLNRRMRERALAESTANVGYLKQELEATNVVPLQQALGRLLEIEMQKMMIARGSSEFSFRVVDPPQVPRWPVRPRAALSVVGAALLGLLVAVFVVVARHYVGERRAFAAATRDRSISSASAARS